MDRQQLSQRVHRDMHLAATLAFISVIARTRAALPS
jgi:hypothetical protein